MKASTAERFITGILGLVAMFTLTCWGEVHIVKTRGVYTTMFIPELRPLASFDLPSDATIQYNNFGPGDVPVVVVTGYEEVDVTLHVIDCATGKVLTSLDSRPSLGKVLAKPLNINRSGKYEARLLVRGKKQDSFKFTVVREPVRNEDGEVNYDAEIAAANRQLQMDPEDWLAFTVRGLAHRSKGEFVEAIRDFSDAIRLSPKDITPHGLRAETFSIQRKWDKAIADYDDCIRLRPDDPRGLHGRALVHERSGNLDKAISDLRGALRVEPGYPRACNELAWILATAAEDRYRNGREAVTLAKKACQSAQWREARYIDTLAASYAEAGDFESASKFENQALEQPNVPLLTKVAFRQRLALYEQRMAYRRPSTTTK